MRTVLCRSGVSGKTHLLSYAEAVAVSTVYGSGMKQLSDLFDTIIAAFNSTSEGIIISNPREPDNPIAYANQAFYDMTGYAEDDVIGRNCRFLQTDSTSPEQLDRLRRALAAQERCVVELENARKDGSVFLNRLSIVPIIGDDGALEHYVGIQSDVTELRAAQRDQERLRALSIVMRTVNDVVLNAFNGLLYYRELIADGQDLSPEELGEFSDMISLAAEKLKAMESVESFETKAHGAVETLRYTPDSAP